jgi:hypothetical protein
MNSEAAPQATRQAAHLAALPATPAAGRIAGNPHLDCDSEPAFLPRSLRHRRADP